MTEYVLCFAVSIDNPDIDWIVLVEKKHSDWQPAGYTLPGGRMRSVDETPEGAATRLLKSSTSLETQVGDCEVRGTMYGLDYVSHVVLCPFHGPFSVNYSGGHHPLVTGLREALGLGMNILPELRVIIPLCIARTHFRMLVSDDRNFFSYTLQVS
ncbi:hypothetical protein LCGC14_2027520 [marine sediment metagenome]|uniref:Nudix hydrolase domain-containing protein n=1 Tax=marine sediment metagenome TaxID=412755 RepID=A0A0F9FI65_9ZZZZ